MHSWELFDPPFLGTLVNDTLWAAVDRMDNLRMRCSQLEQDDLRTTESQTASKNLTYSSSATRNLWAKQLCMSFKCCLHVFCMSFAFFCDAFCVSVACVSVAFNGLGLKSKNINSQQVSLGQLAQCCLLRYYFEVSKPAETRQSGMLARLPNQKSNIWNVIHGTLADHTYLESEKNYFMKRCGHHISSNSQKTSWRHGILRCCPLAQPTQLQPFQSLHSPMPLVDQPTPLQCSVKRHSHNGSSKSTIDQVLEAIMMNI